jgi:hypothetical protein
MPYLLARVEAATRLRRHGNAFTRVEADDEACGRSSLNMNGITNERLRTPLPIPFQGEPSASSGAVRSVRKNQGIFCVAA